METTIEVSRELAFLIDEKEKIVILEIGQGEKQKQFAISLADAVALTQKLAQNLLSR